MMASVRWVVWGALFLIPFLPLYVADNSFFPFITGKGFGFRILVEIAAAGWVILALADKRYRPQKSWILFAYGALIAWMFIADLLALNPHKAFWSNYERMDGWVTLVHAGVFFVVLGSILQVHKLWSKWWLTFVGASAIVCAYGILQIMHVLQIHQGGRVDASFGNAAYLPAYLLFAIAFSLWQGFTHRGWLRYGLFVLAALQVFILLFTATRGALLGLVAAIVVSSFVWAMQSGKTGRNTAIGIVMGIVLLGGIFFTVRDSTFVKESLTLSRLSSVFSLQKELQVRLRIWNTGLEGVAERPLTGYGHEGFNYVFNKFYDPSLFTQEQWFDRAHNVYLDWLIAGGIPALLLFLALLGIPFVLLYRKDFTPIERMIGVGALTAYAVQGVVVFDNLFTYVPLAALLAYIHTRSARPFTMLESVAEVKGPSLDTVTAVGAVCAIAIVWVVNVPSMIGSSEIIRAFATPNDPAQSMAHLQRALAAGSFGRQEIREQMSNFAINAASRADLTPEVRGSVLNTAASEMGKEITSVPNDARLRMQFATLLRAGGDTEGSFHELAAALSLSPKKQTLMLERGITYIQVNKLEEARASFYEAYDLDHSFAQVAAYAAAGDILTGRLAEGNALIAQHFPQSRADVPQIVLIAYQNTNQQEPLIAILKDKVTAAGGSIDSRLQLATAYALFGRIPEARKEVEDIIAAYPNMAEAGAGWITQLEALKK